MDYKKIEREQTAPKIRIFSANITETYTKAHKFIINYLIVEFINIMHYCETKRQEMYYFPWIF